MCLTIKSVNMDVYKRGGKRHIFLIALMRESKHGVCRNISLELTKTQVCVRGSPAALFGKQNDGAVENNNHPPLIVIVCDDVSKCTRLLNR